MCGIAGFCNIKENYTSDAPVWSRVLSNMGRVQKRRGPDDDGIYLKDKCGMAHVRLSVIDLYTGGQPLSRYEEGRTCTIVYNGETYNMPELKAELKAKGVRFHTNSDTEVVLAGYMREGIDFVKKLNGVFAFALWDPSLSKLFLVRDRLGVKPIFYTIIDGTLVFSSEIKGLFEYPGVKAELDADGLCEVFAIGPAKSLGKGVFKNIYEVMPGSIAEYSDNSLREYAYWKLESKTHEDSFDETVSKTAYLLRDAVTKQMLSDVPICTFLSGGVDSSLVTAICADELRKRNKTLNTFSFDFQGNDIYFKGSTFQPSVDRPFVDIMVEYSKTNHTYLMCTNQDMIDCLFKTVDARDLPCMADVESSLLYFCSKVVDYNKVALTGECADEIFGGYPWFHKREFFEADAFPWSKDMEPRKTLLSDETLNSLPLSDYARAAYEKSIAETPRLAGESREEARRREIAYLNLRWFMITLLDRMDRTSMYSGLEARVPFADHRIVEYIWNVPWEFKAPNGLVKGLLRAAGEGILPHDILYRKKSPYPKTYHPEYEKALGSMLLETVSDPNAPIRQFLDINKLKSFIASPSDYGKPWYGQLMAGPQMLAYMLQVNYWLDKYKISIV